MRRQGTPGSANWGTWTPDPDGICHDCGRDFAGHAGTGCFAPDTSGLALPRPSRDTCPLCLTPRQQLLIAPGRFYCPTCELAGPGPINNVEGEQLQIGLDRAPP